ncbi:MAG: helix-turn-helix domain-containing protein [Methanomicrobia archaeon]|nr:helix-turn-helix domain-containing protein [Methanomicrobia archaeon]
MIFKALSSTTRMAMLRLLLQDEYHVSGLANELGISVPVAAKHVKLLEDADLVHRKAFGRTHVLSANRKRLYDAMDTFSADYELHTQGGGINILDALKEVDGIGIKKVGEKEFIASIDGEEGFYIYEVNGKSPAVPINEYTMESGGEIRIKRLVPVLTKRVTVRIPSATDGKKRGRE